MATCYELDSLLYILQESLCVFGTVFLCFRQNGQCNDKGITECDTLAYGNGEGRFCIGHLTH